MGLTRTKLLVGAGFCCFLWLLQSYLAILEFDRQQILSGEFWRIWTGHLVHTNTNHYALNSVAAIIIYFVFFNGIKLGELLLCSFIFAALNSVILLCIYPDIVWYNGLSGLLHALVAYFCMRLATDEEKLFWVGLVFVWSKVLIEAVLASSGYESLIGDMAVITEAHLIGVFVGCVAFIIRKVFLRVKEKHNTSKWRVSSW